MLILRSVVFNILFYLNLILHLIVAMPTLLLPRRAIIEGCEVLGAHQQLAAALWPASRSSIRGLREDSARCAARRLQASVDLGDFRAATLFDDPAFILKRELMWIPFFGWLLWKAEHDPGRSPARTAARWPA